jgi:superfamily II DNA helicase RecQ
LPLINLRWDQVKKLWNLGVRAVSLSGIESAEEAKALQEGTYSVLYGTPESFVKDQTIGTNAFQQSV